jgi:hypothetical protein
MLEVASLRCGLRWVGLGAIGALQSVASGLRPGTTLLVHNIAAVLPLPDGANYRPIDVLLVGHATAALLGGGPVVLPL